MLIMLFTGLVNFDDSINKFLVRGNRLYADNNYEQALSAYNDGLKKDSENLKLNYNSGDPSYLLKDYQNAVTYYDKAYDTPDKYLNSGNSSLKMGDGTEDVNQKIQYYRLALDTYKKGILAFPENVPLKYNYEYAKKKLEELGDDSGENQDNEENKDENEENQDNQNQDNSQGGQNDSQQQNEEEQGDAYEKSGWKRTIIRKIRMKNRAMIHKIRTENRNRTLSSRRITQDKTKMNTKESSPNKTRGRMKHQAASI